MIDKYVYPGTNILINKFDCRDEEELRRIEALSTGGNLAWLQLHPIEGTFDFNHLEFTRELCLNCGYVLDLTKTRHEEMLAASIVSFNKGDSTDFINIFRKQRVWPARLKNKINSN